MTSVILPNKLFFDVYWLIFHPVESEEEHVS